MKKSIRRKRFSRRPSVEKLEDRQLLAGDLLLGDLAGHPNAGHDRDHGELDQDDHDHDHLEFHAGADVPFGVYTPEEIEAFDTRPFDSSLSSKTPLNLAEGQSLTFVLDFKEAGQPITSDIFGARTTTFDLGSFGFAANEFETVYQSILEEVKEDFFDELVGTVAGPSGRELDVDFIIGDIGTTPPNVAEFYFIQIGSGIGNNPLGQAGGSVVRNSSGNGPNSGISVGDVVGSVFTNEIRSIGGLSPSNALTSGNVGFTTFGIGGTLSHEIGHTLSLSHISRSGSVQPTNGLSPTMGTGAIDLPNQQRIRDREFSLSGRDGQSGNAPRMHVQQLVDALGLRDADIREDRFEQNDSLATATNLGSDDQTQSELTIEVANDDDYYQFTAAANGMLDVDIEFIHNDGNLDLEVLDIDGNLLASSESQTNNEALTVRAFSGQSYFVRVFGADSATQADYTLNLDGPEQLCGSPFHLSGEMGDGNPDFYFTPSTGALVVDADGAFLQFMKVAGPVPISDDFSEPFWSYTYFNDALQWFLPPGFDAFGGQARIATFAPGADPFTTFPCTEFGFTEIDDPGAQSFVAFTDVTTDDQSPTAIPVVSDVTSAGGTRHQFVVTFTDNVGVDAASITDGDFVVSGPNGYSSPASIDSLTENPDGSVVVVYSIPAAGGVWDATDNGTYSITSVVDEVADLGGLTLAGDVVVDSFEVNVTGGGDPLDLDNNGAIDGDDIDTICLAIADNSMSAAFDIDGNGVIDDSDFDAYLSAIGTLPGDANLDGVVDVGDFAIWNANKFTFNDPSLHGVGWATGDFDCSGGTDVSDFAVWNANKFTSAAATLVDVSQPTIEDETAEIQSLSVETEVESNPNSDFSPIAPNDFAPEPYSTVDSSRRQPAERTVRRASLLDEIFADLG